MIHTPRRTPARLAVIVSLSCSMATACGGDPLRRATRAGPANSTTTTTTGPKPAAVDDESLFGPLAVGADFLTYRRVTDAPFLSIVHRAHYWVDVYVNERGAEAYLGQGEVPVGTVLVKQSWLDDDGRNTGVPGPLFIMEKRAPGYAPDHEDWYFALHWADPPPPQRAMFGGPVYWRGRSPRVEMCADCHDSYDRGLGGLVPSSLMPR